MKPNLWKVSLLTACLCASTLVARAIPLQRADVMGDPAWLLHVDCDELRSSTLGKFVLSELDKPEPKAKLDAFQAIIGSDPRTQLHGITLYGNSKAPEDGVLMIYGEFDADKLVIIAKAAEQYESTDHNKVVIHSWIDDKKKAKNGGKPRIFAAIKGKRVIFSQHEDRVALALDVLDGTAPNLTASKEFPDLGAAGNTHFVEAAARKMDIPDSDPNAAILKLSKSVQLMAGEQQQQIRANLTLIADTDEVGGHINSIAQGLLSLMKLQRDKPEALSLANRIEIKQDGAKVIGSIALPTEDVIGMVKTKMDHKAAHVTKESKE